MPTGIRIIRSEINVPIEIAADTVGLARDRITAGDFHSVRLTDGTAFYVGAKDRTTAADFHSVRLTDGTAFITPALTGQLPATLTAAGNLKISIEEAVATVPTTWTPRPWKSLVSITAEVVAAGTTLTLVNVTGAGFVQEVVVVMDYDMRLTVTVDGTSVIDNLWSELDDLDTASNLISAWSPATGEYAIKLNVGNLLGFGSSLVISVTNPDTVADHNILRKSIHYSLA